MYDESLEKLLSKAPATDLEYHLTGHRGQKVGPPRLPPPRLPPPRDRFDQPRHDRRKPDEPASITGLLLAISLYLIFSTSVVSVVLWKLN